MSNHTAFPDSSENLALVAKSNSEFHDSALARAEWERRQVDDAFKEWYGFWSGLLIALMIAGTVVAVVVCVLISIRLSQ